mmetsp:Transcript_57736/g.175872  ORF Transcript_57736/g.175872 Transcript_57736/m.175872 type:complete len:212 (-) Transcript_57736:79-714(-)
MACAAAAKNRPGSAMTRRSGEGNSSSNISLMSAAWSAKVAWPAASAPGKPPPMSSRVMAKPWRSASSNTARARRSAPRKAPRCEQPLPTWKETPTTRRPRALACSNNASQLSVAAPNLLESGHWASESSVCTRRSSSASGNSSASLLSSEALSNTRRRTPLARACRTAEVCLHGFAKTTRSPACSSPTAAATKSISAMLAQSKPPPPRCSH